MLSKIAFVTDDNDDNATAINLLHPHELRDDDISVEAPHGKGGHLRRRWCIICPHFFLPPLHLSQKEDVAGHDHLDGGDKVAMAALTRLVAQGRR